MREQLKMVVWASRFSLFTLLLGISVSAAVAADEAIPVSFSIDSHPSGPATEAIRPQFGPPIDREAGLGNEPQSILATCPAAAIVLPNNGFFVQAARAPVPINRFERGVYLITPAEVAASGLAAGTPITGIGWTYNFPPGVAASAPLKIYLENTTDSTRNKSTTWATAIAPMTLAHNATTALPNSATSFTITFSGGSSFTYNGNGLYVAFDWGQYTGALATPSASTVGILVNTTLAASGLFAVSDVSAPATVATSSANRPETILIASVTVPNNDASVVSVRSYGVVPRDLAGSQIVEAVVRNVGSNPLSNLPVTLSVTGANPFSNTQIVPSLAACGGQATVVFAAQLVTTLGSDVVAASVPADDVAANNSRSVNRDVTLPRYSFKYPGSVASGGVGLTGGTGAFAGKFTTSAATAITAVELEFAATSATTYRIAVYADSGSGTPGANLYTDAADRTVGVAGPVTIPIGPVSVGPGNFFVGIQQTNTTNANLSFDNESPLRVGKFYLSAPLPVTTWSDFAPANLFKLNIGVVLDPCSGVSCDDGNPCTNDSCIAAAGCVYTQVPDGTVCDDGNVCSNPDTCQGGVCVSGSASCFPPAGTDTSPTDGNFHVDVSGLGPVTTSSTGLTHLQWSNPTTGPTGLHTVQTELLGLSLTGSSPTLGSFTLKAGTENGLQPSLGRVDQISSGPDFPAHAFFDVFFEVTVNGTTTLRNSDPLVMEADITEIPPRNIGLRNASAVTITNTLDPSQVSVLSAAQHWMCPPPFPPPGQPCPVPCGQSFAPLCDTGDCPGHCSISGGVCRVAADCPVGETCQGVLRCAPESAIPGGSCVCKEGFTGAGSDLSPTTGIFRVDITGLGTVDTSVAGDSLLQWQNPVTGPDGRRTVQTEMLSMDLTGSVPGIGSLRLRAGSNQGLQPTLGTVTAIEPGVDFPANSFFDVFFDIEVNGTTHLRNDQPLVMRADITEIPPRNIGLRNDAPVQVHDLTAPGQIHTIQTAQHWMCPPPYPPPGQPCPVPCDRAPYPVCAPGTCPTPSQRCVPLAPFFDQDGLVGKCVCVDAFPPAGTDNSPTVGTFQVDLGGIGSVVTSVSGNTLLQWQNPVVGPGGQRTVATELISLDLNGSDPSLGNVHVRAGSAQGLPPSTGSVVPQAVGSDFPANAFFDVFFEVTVNGTTTLVNDQPLVMRAPITEIPPRSLGLQNASPVPLRNLANPSQVNTIQTAQHWMCPPPYPPPGQPCPVPCERNPYPVCKQGTCPIDATGTLLKCAPDKTLKACRCVRPSFPNHGVDLSATTGVFRVDIAGLGVTDAQVSGQVLLRWQDPVTGPGGQPVVDTEMLSLDLTGTSPTLGPIHILGGSNHGLPATTGQVTPLSSGSDFPALAFFDVFFEVQASGQTLVNDQPLHMEADINEIPPRSLALRNAAPVALRNLANPAQNNSIQTAAHWMCPPPYPPNGGPCPVACNALPQPLCSFGVCPFGLECRSSAAGACGCVSQLVAGSGEVSKPATPQVPLKVTKAAGGQITLTWSTSCVSSDTDYGIYEGVVPSYYSHTGLFCSTSGATTKTLTPGTGSRYYLVVPHGGSVEGSYGRRKTGAERPPGTAACLPQSIGTCP